MWTFTTILVFAALATASSFVTAGPAVPLEDNFYNINEFGGYHFGYNDGRIARQEERSPEGVVRGAYSYVDADGQIQVVTYTADKHNGFLVSGTNVPKIGRIPEVGEVGEIIEETPAAVVQNTPEVAAARVEHLDAVRRVRLGEGNGVPLMIAPVAYTPEVAAARAEHLNVHGQEVLRNSGGAPAAQFHPDYLPYAGL